MIWNKWLEQKQETIQVGGQPWDSRLERHRAWAKQCSQAACCSKPVFCVFSLLNIFQKNIPTSPSLHTRTRSWCSCLSERQDRVSRKSHTFDLRSIFFSELSAHYEYLQSEIIIFQSLRLKTLINFSRTWLINNTMRKEKHLGHIKKGPLWGESTFTSQIMTKHDFFTIHVFSSGDIICTNCMYWKLWMSSMKVLCFLLHRDTHPLIIISWLVGW